MESLTTAGNTLLSTALTYSGPIDTANTLKIIPSTANMYVHTTKTVSNVNADAITMNTFATTTNTIAATTNIVLSAANTVSTSLLKNTTTNTVNASNIVSNTTNTIAITTGMVVKTTNMIATSKNLIKDSATILNTFRNSLTQKDMIRPGVMSPSNWFQTCAETIDSPKRVEPSINICKSTIVKCSMPSLKGFYFCHKHILEDRSSPFKRCSFISKTDYKRCINPAPKLGVKRCYCILHTKDLRKVANANKKKKKKSQSSNSERKPGKKRPSTLTVANDSKKDSSSEEEFSFFTDTVQVNTTDCLWLGNQASDADSTDSEDENPLNHAGIWTVEECVRICRDKMVRLQSLYAEQFKRLNYVLKEERRKMLNKYDMDPYILSKVAFEKKTGNTFDDYMQDVTLSNYQRFSHSELIAEKLMKDKRNRGLSLHSRRSDLPRCQLNTDGHRCQHKVLPFSKYCYLHICNDSDQYLYSPCSKRKKCSAPVEMYLKAGAACNHHLELLPTTYGNTFENLRSSKKARETRRKKREEMKEKEKEELKRKRASDRLKENELKCKSEEVDIDVSGNKDDTTIVVDVDPALENKETKMLKCSIALEKSSTEKVVDPSVVVLEPNKDMDKLAKFNSENVVDKDPGINLGTTNVANELSNFKQTMFGCSQNNDKLVEKEIEGNTIADEISAIEAEECTHLKMTVSEKSLKTMVLGTEKCDSMEFVEDEICEEKK